MKRIVFGQGVLPLALGALLLGGCVTREVVYQPAPPPAGAQEVVVDGPPPPALVEPMPPAPGPDFIWIGGAWTWNGRWVWTRGYWGHPPHPGAVWVPHHYQNRHGVHVYVRGYWR